MLQYGLIRHKNNMDHKLNITVTYWRRGEKYSQLNRAGHQGRAETFGGTGAQSIKGAHGTRLLIAVPLADLCIEMDASVLIQQQMP